MDTSYHIFPIFFSISEVPPRVSITSSALSTICTGLAALLVTLLTSGTFLHTHQNLPWSARIWRDEWGQDPYLGYLGYLGNGNFPKKNGVQNLNFGNQTNLT